MSKTILTMVGQSVLTAALVSLVFIWSKNGSNQSAGPVRLADSTRASMANSVGGQQEFGAGFRPYRVDAGTRLSLFVTNRSGRFTARLGGNMLCDINGNRTPKAYVKDLVPGVVALEISARDFGKNKYDADFELKATTPANHDSTLVGPFTYTNPDDEASNSVEGTTIYIEVPQPNIKPELKNRGDK